MGATLGLHGADKAWMGDRRVWGRVLKAPSPEEQGVISTECQGTIAASRQAYVHRQARSLCSCAKEGIVGGGLGSEGRRWSPGHAHRWPGSEGPLTGSNTRWGPEGESLFVDMASVQGRACFLEKREGDLEHLFKAS